METALTIFCCLLLLLFDGGGLICVPGCVCAVDCRPRFWILRVQKRLSDALALELQMTEWLTVRTGN